MRHRRNPARREAWSDGPRSFSRGNIIAGVGFEHFTPASMRRGETEDEGWEREKESMSFSEASELVRSYLPYDSVQEYGKGTLIFRCADPHRNFRDGSETYYEVVVQFSDSVTLDRFLAWYNSYIQRQRTSRFGAW